ncbi:DNA/RNA non-specific endonuclease [Kordia sp. YSTF-M3]|uniref:DNA/RNA non-specific endonuclease n=1 Tax=Kordia aestuariivivens TaxID=2759037 RepID=A0ABR7Q5M8_9FLAO|nr:DNA/RNA non-specific endonuclease [Kordia aestuariivivens]MBC8753866.1 DNA/RNA non-specific endonuclease [Kordia aestuariivivens]
MSYVHHFFESHPVHTPSIHPEEVAKFNAAGLELSDYYLAYQNYSVLQNPFRKFPYYSAVNVDGTCFHKLKRDTIFEGSERWEKDARIPEETQWGKALYDAEKYDFDKGHMAKREDVQWGTDVEAARLAAKSTFYYTNAIPQVSKLNRGVWKSIENYILHHEAVKDSMKICLFSGPAFREDDPEFLKTVNDEKVRLPYLFWKVVYYVHNNELHRAGFLTSQKRLMQKKRIVKPVSRSEGARSTQFNSFKDAETYQVNVSFIEQISQLTFEAAAETFQSDAPEKIILSRVNVRNSSGNESVNMEEIVKNMNLKL